eukprot:CAMPEP_0114476734 /NCGR_PEP_ID=MMETSP0104-20121206/14939_1 /TAXON_ID=37642 ORGANISM="Paraphysomonas imperforata, Strain PA2" /NCGR_SAMPLE_ID=MMETSP0104 /ASSEMBLY_ACC=CAM_ASM_000202 /LENGTH=147 /DNA_ID=CAMNT_0001651537 /DNA_START=41 /DNA_END=484 /DNA_ORIENTATION=-
MTDIFEGDPDRANLTTVNELDENGFVINEHRVRHPVILLPRNFFMWNTYKFEDIDVASLDIFSFLYPTVECVFIGGGAEGSQRLPLEVMQYFRNRGIMVESMDSMNAAQTFNLLISEGRNVGAAILPLYPFPEGEHEFRQNRGEFDN